MIEATCHCGNIKIEVPGIPSSITSCNCSICNKLGARWANYPPEEVKISFEKKATVPYVWGDKYIEFHRCTICGCTTHYSMTEKFDGTCIKLNCRMLQPELISSVIVRKFDGADTWKYLDEQGS